MELGNLNLQLSASAAWAEATIGHIEDIINDPDKAEQELVDFVSKKISASEEEAQIEDAWIANQAEEEKKSWEFIMNGLRTHGPFYGWHQTLLERDVHTSIMEYESIMLKNLHWHFGKIERILQEYNDTIVRAINGLADFSAQDGRDLGPCKLTDHVEVEAAIRKAMYALDSFVEQQKQKEREERYGQNKH